MARTKNSETERSQSVRLSVSLPQQLHDKLERKAQENDASIAWVVRRAVTSYLQESVGASGSDVRH